MNRLLILVHTRAAMVEDGFPWPNSQGKEYLRSDPKAPLPAFFKLSKTGDQPRVHY